MFRLLLILLLAIGCSPTDSGDDGDSGEGRADTHGN